MQKLLKKYLPDILTQLGVWIFAYNTLRQPRKFNAFDFTDYHTEWKILGVVLISIGINIAIRRLISYFKKK